MRRMEDIIFPSQRCEMTKIYCDFCGKEIERYWYHGKLELKGIKEFTCEIKDCCTSCKDKLVQFILIDMKREKHEKNSV